MSDDITEQMQRMNANLEQLIATFKAFGEQVAPAAAQVAEASGRVAWQVEVKYGPQ